MGIRKFIKYLSFSLLVIPLLSSCSGGLSSGNFEIEFTDGIPTAYVNESYDFTKVLKIENGIEYKLTASYYDYNAKTMTELEVKNFCFTPITLADVAVKVEAHNKTYTKTRKESVRVKAKGDPLDELLSVGASNFCDTGASKKLNISEEFIVDGTSSILVSYYGNNPYYAGCSIISPNNFRCLNYFTDQTWENAILTFWVFNPTDYTFEFQLRLQQKNEDGYTVIDTEWGYPFNVPQKAEPGIWTQVFFSLNKLGVNKPLIQSEDGKQKDEFNIKTRWAGTPKEVETYKWQMYVDGLDIVPASTFSQIDTQKDVSSETISDGWESLRLDTGEKSGYGRSKPLYRTDIVRTAEYASKSALNLTFANTIPANDIGYSVAFSPEEQKVINKQFTLPQFNRGTIKADINFSSNIKDKTINFAITQKTADDSWDTRMISGLVLSPLEGDWYRLNFDFAKVKKFNGFGRGIRFVIQFNGINNANKSSAKVVLDNIFFDQEGTGPAPDIPNRGDPFKAGTDYSYRFSTPITDYSSTILNIDIKSTNGSNKVAVGLMHDWDPNYFGYFILGEETYKGVTITKLDDGYTRYSFKIDELEQIEISAPTSIDHIYVRGAWTEATGYIDISVE